MIDHQAGLDDLSDALTEAATTPSAEEWVERLSFQALNALILTSLDTTYPLPYFQAEQYGVTWRGERAGADIDPGVRWATLLRLALKQLEPAQSSSALQKGR